MRFIQKEVEVPVKGRGRPKKESKLRELTKPGKYTSEELSKTKPVLTGQGSV